MNNNKYRLIAAALAITFLTSGCTQDKCGDGICQPQEERKGNCPQDCGSVEIDGLPPACQIEDISLLIPMSGGFDLSPIDENIVIYAIPDNAGIHQIHKRDLDTGEDVCLTCDNLNAPAGDLHKGVPLFHPDGNHIILMVEMEEHPFKGQISMGGGWFYNVWMTTIDGDKWWQLTDYPHGKEDVYGVLLPKISHDGKKVAWAQLYKGDPQSQYDYSQGKIVPNSNPWGLWQLNIADLLIDENPRLENITSYRPGNGNFFETQDWSPDDKKLLFAADIQIDHVYKIDIWMMDIETQELTQLTDTDDAFEEFASFSPDGKKISYMSSECCNWDPMSTESIPFESTLRTDLYLMNSDGTGKTQITNINQAGLPGTKWDKYLQWGQIVTGSIWSSDGKKIFFGMLFFDEDGNPLGNAVWQLTFRDACGNLK